MSLAVSRLLVLAAVVLVGCGSSAVRVSVVAPKPPIRRTPAMDGVPLSLASTPDTLRVRASGAVVLELVDIHAALRRGFMEGVGGRGLAGSRTLALSITAVELVDASSTEDQRADSSGGASFLLAHGSHSVKVARIPRARTLRIAFLATLREGARVVAELASEAHGSSFTSLSSSAVSESVTAAIADMFIQIAEHFFERPTA